MGPSSYWTNDVVAPIAPQHAVKTDMGARKRPHHDTRSRRSLRRPWVRSPRLKDVTHRNPAPTLFPTRNRLRPLVSATISFPSISKVCVILPGILHGSRRERDEGGIRSRTPHHTLITHVCIGHAKGPNMSRLACVKKRAPVVFATSASI